MRVLALLALLVCACASNQGPLPPGAEVELGEAELEAEGAALQALHLPRDLVLRAPYAPPYSARSLIVPARWYRAPLPGEVDPRALAGDLRILERLLPLAYVAYPLAARRDLDWGAFFRAWRADLAAEPRPTLPLAEAFAPMERWRNSLADPLSGPAGETPAPRSHVSLLPGPVPEPCDRVELASGAVRALLRSDPAQRPRVVRIARDEGSRLEGAVYLAHPAPLVRVHCARGWIPATPVRSVTPASPEPAFQSLGGGVGLLRLPALDEAHAEDYAALRPELEAAAEGAVALVVDLRGAGGDRPEVALPLLAAYLGGSFVPPRPTRMALGSCLAGALAWGTQRREGGPLDAAAEAVRASAGARCEAPPVMERGTWSHAGRRFDRSAEGPLVLVVVDGGCRGGCEALVYTLGASPRTVIAGVNTAGAIEYRGPGTLVLPGTKVPFRLATRRVDPYGDGRSVDGYGLDVDVLLATPDSGSERSLRELVFTLLR